MVIYVGVPQTLVHGYMLINNIHWRLSEFILKYVLGFGVLKVFTC